MKINNRGYENCCGCGGKGYEFKKERVIHRCKNCKGIGKLDWVIKVTKYFELGEIPTMYDLVERWKKDNKLDFFIVRSRDNWAFGEPYENQ